ncbi:MAG TPA: tetratricopeptide repeat protein [Chthoniobacterales bacterium]|jgi:tetratricopeptide (TPR) repeat protein
MENHDPSAAGYRWLKTEHPDLDFWGIKSPLPWPNEKGEKIERKNHFPFRDLLEGIDRLRAGGKEWKADWGAVETFLGRGEELNAALERSDFARALRMLDELETLRPGTPYRAFNSAFILRAQGDWAGALAAAIAATERAPTLEYLWMRRGDLHEHEEQGRDAIFCYRKALALLPGHPQALDSLARLGAMSKMTFHHPDGTHKVQYFTPDEFHRYVAENAANTAPEDPQLRSLLRQFRESTSGEDALAVIDRILDGNPSDRQLLRVYRADALRVLGRLDDASDLVGQVIIEEPTLAEAHYVNAWCEYEMGYTKEGDKEIERVLEIDPNHNYAIQCHLHFTERKDDPKMVETLCDWGKEHGSWRAYWLAAFHASNRNDHATALRCAEAAYRLAPQERDALFFYASALNNMNEGEHTAALIHPRLPEAKGDFELKYVFAGAMKKLGLRDEAIRVLRELLEEENEITVEFKGWAQHFLDELTGLVAQGEVDLDFHPGTDVLRREIWIGDDEGPKKGLIFAGVSVPVERAVQMEPAPGYTGSTGSIAVYLHGQNAELDPVSLGWFRAHEIEFAAGKPLMTIRVTEHKKLEATALQGTRRLPVTWSMYRVPSMETEGAPPPAAS